MGKRTGRSVKRPNGKIVRDPRDNGMWMAYRRFLWFFWVPVPQETWEYSPWRRGYVKSRGAYYGTRSEAKAGLDKYFYGKHSIVTGTESEEYYYE